MNPFQVRNQKHAKDTDEEDTDRSTTSSIPKPTAGLPALEHDDLDKLSSGLDSDSDNDIEPSLNIRKVKAPSLKETRHNVKEYIEELVAINEILFMKVKALNRYVNKLHAREDEVMNNKLILLSIVKELTAELEAVKKSDKLKETSINEKHNNPRRRRTNRLSKPTQNTDKKNDATQKDKDSHVNSSYKNNIKDINNKENLTKRVTSITNNDKRSALNKKQQNAKGMIIGPQPTVTNKKVSQASSDRTMKDGQPIADKRSAPNKKQTNAKEMVIEPQPTVTNKKVSQASSGRTLTDCKPIADKRSVPNKKQTNAKETIIGSQPTVTNKKVSQASSDRAMKDCKPIADKRSAPNKKQTNAKEMIIGSQPTVTNKKVSQASSRRTMKDGIPIAGNDFVKSFSPPPFPEVITWRTPLPKEVVRSSFGGSSTAEDIQRLTPHTQGSILTDRESHSPQVSRVRDSCSKPTLNESIHTFIRVEDASLPPEYVKTRREKSSKDTPVYSRIFSRSDGSPVWNTNLQAIPRNIDVKERKTAATSKDIISGVKVVLPKIKSTSASNSQQKSVSFRKSNTGIEVLPSLMQDPSKFKAKPLKTSSRVKLPPIDNAKHT